MEQNPQPYSPKESVPQGSLPQNSTPKSSAPQGSAPQNGTPQSTAPRGITLQGSAPVVKPEVKETKPQRKSPVVVYLLCAAAVIAAVMAGSSLIKQALAPAKNSLSKNKTVKKVAASLYEKKVYHPDSYVLEGLIYDGEASTVIINGKVLKMHETIDAYEVISVTPSSVELKNRETGAGLSLSL